MSSAQAEVQDLAEREASLRQQLRQVQEAQVTLRAAQQQEAQQRIVGKQRLLQSLPDSAALQSINEQLGAVRSMGEQVQQARDAAAAQEQAIQAQLRELSRNPLHPMTKPELEAQLQIQPPAPPQVAQLLISLALGLCGGGFLWYEIGRPQILWLCAACAVTALAAGNFLRLLIQRIRRQQVRHRELQRQEELRKLADSYLPMLEKLEEQHNLLQQRQQAVADSEQRLRATLADLLTVVQKWDAGVHTPTDVRRFVQQTAQRREALAEEVRQAQADALHAQTPDADGSAARLQQQIAQVQGQLAALGGTEDAPQRIAHKQEQLHRLQGEYDSLALALDALRSANTTLQNRFSPELGRRAAEIFADMTGSAWSHILLDREFRLSAEAGSSPTRRSVQLLSSGTADQLYLAVRLAICEMVLPVEQNAPLILDDALLTFDDERLHKTLDYLVQLGSRRQILLFSCQSREVDYLTGRSGVHILNLQ